MSTTINIESNTVQLSAGKTAYQILGNRSASNFMLVFGGYHFPRNCDLFFQALAAELGSDHAILLYDYYGRGDSDSPDGMFDVDMYMQQAAELIDQLGLQERSFHVLGYSFGGSTATHFCHRFPEKARSLILSGAWNTWEGFPAATRVMTKFGMSNMLYHFYWKAMPGALRDGFDDPDNAQPIIDNMLKVEQAIIDRDPAQLKRSILRTFRNFTRNTQETVKAISTHPRKVLLAWGKNDAIASFKYAEAIHEVIPNSKLAGLDGNHNDLWLVPQKEQVLRAEITAFLNEIS